MVKLVAGDEGTGEEEGITKCWSLEILSVLTITRDSSLLISLNGEYLVLRPA